MLLVPFRRGGKNQKGGLTLDTRSGIREGGNSAPPSSPVIPGRACYFGPSGTKTKSRKMPKRKLPDSVIADFENWIAMGAPDPRGGGRVEEKARRHPLYGEPDRPRRQEPGEALTTGRRRRPGPAPR